MSAELCYTLDQDALIAEAEKLPWDFCVQFRVERDGSHHACANCGRSLSAHIIAALVAKLHGVWQPMETAPKDGTDILVCEGGRRWINRWHVCHTTRVLAGGAVEEFVSYDDWQRGQFTYWMPLQEPPK